MCSYFVDTLLLANDPPPYLPPLPAGSKQNVSIYALHNTFERYCSAGGGSGGGAVADKVRWPANTSNPDLKMNLKQLMMLCANIGVLGGKGALA